jgi:hypothetical protein
MVALLFKSLRIRRRQDAFSHDGNQFPDRFCRSPNFDATNRLLTNANAAACRLLRLSDVRLFIERRSGGLVTFALGATVAIGAVTNLAAGAILGVALAAPRPYYYGPRCYIRRECFWDGWAWHVRRVEDCY